MSDPTFEIPGLVKELPGQDWSASISCAYWLGVRRAHVRDLDNRVRNATTPAERATYLSLREEVSAKAERDRAELIALLGGRNTP